MPAVRIDAARPAEQLPPLPFAEQEAKEVSCLLGVAALTGGAATKEAVVSSMSNKRFIHFATHGLLDDIEGLGLPGAIALAPSAADDGLLTAREIMDLQLDAELVVLSACNTGRGRITGDGVVGLSRSFIHAGATCLLVSLWSVDDASTSRLVANFYRNLAHAPSKAEALRQAMLSMMKLEKKSPVHWAPFVLVGDGRTGSAPSRE
jgi:CHAT domain-containing protein